MYYNTNNETGNDLKKAQKKTISQDQFILGIFNTWRKDNGMTPSEIEHILVDSYDVNWPLTSIRRSISTLTDSGKLTKTNELRKGKYNKNEHVWKLKGDE